MLRNVTTTNEHPPPNKFSLNAKKVDGKAPLTAIKDFTAQVFKGKDINMEKDSTKQDLGLQPMTSQQLEDFAKKKQERDQEIMEIQDMLNKMKSPQKITKRSSQEPPLMNKQEDKPEESLPSSRTTTEKNKVTEKTEKDSPFFGRCKTELQMFAKPFDSANSRVARKDTVRTSSSAAATSKPRSKSSQWPASAKEHKSNKKLNYNPEEARRYMEMQRKQRKENLLKDPTIKSKIEKEEIKKRLEELKKNTRKLVSKSMQKRDKLLDKNLTNREAEVIKLPEPKRAIKEIITHKETETANSKSQTNKQNVKSEISQRSENFKVKTTSKSCAREAKIASIDLPGPTLETNQAISHRSTQSLNNVLRPFPQNHKRVGLLRKTENIKDFSLASHRSYNFNKENQNLEMLTKQLMNTVENKPTKDTNNQKESANKNKTAQAFEEEKAIDNKKCDFELTENNLKTLANKEKETPKPNELPYWLRPSVTQVYPYNFIMAVRRKLESIVEPIQKQKPTEDKRNQETSTTGLNDELKAKKRKSLDGWEKKQNKKIKNRQETPTDFSKTLRNNRNVKQNKLKYLKPLPQGIQIKENETKENSKVENTLEEKKISKTNYKYLKKSSQTKDCQDNDQPIKQQQTGAQNSLQTLTADDGASEQISQHLKMSSNFKSLDSLNSEINSNISSISIQMPASNTLTEVSSLRTESRRNYTHSKNKLFTQSEEELVVSINSQIFSSPEKNLQHSEKEFEFIKPRPVSPLSLEKVDKLKIQSRETLSQQATDKGKEMDFSQLLEDFNRSLSHVIRVNEQLKNSLDKSQQILSPASDKKSTESEKYYSSDFEKTPTLIISAKDNDKLEQSLQKSSEKLQTRKRQLFEIAGKVKPFLTQPKSVAAQEEIQMHPSALSHVNLNLSIRSLTTTNVSTSEDEAQTSSSLAAQSNEKRLNEIEKLKETLKQTIFESKKKRNEKQQLRESITKSSTQNENAAESKTATETGLSTKNSAISNEHETQSEEHSNEIKSSFSKYLNNNKDFEKYQKQYKNLKETKVVNDSKVLTQKDLQQTEKNTEFHKNKHDKQIKQNESVNEQPQEMTDYSTFPTNSNSKNTTSQSSAKEILAECKEKTKLPEENPVNESQSETDSTTTRTQDMVHSKSLTKSEESSDTALSSSIAEELQKTFESGCFDNENMPSFSAENKTNLITNFNEEIDSSHFVKTHINRSRGDFQETISEKPQFNETEFQKAIEAASQISSTEFAQSADDEITSSVPSRDCLKSATNLPSCNAGKITSSTCSPAKASISIGSEIVRFFKQYDSERNETRADNNDSMSESSLNYSNVGLYEKLIQNETNKSQHLTALLKLREKALLDRTKGQIAWLEVQKARYKARGFTNQIAAIKKKQRGILLKMDKEREEIKRLLQTTNTNSKTGSATTPLHSSGGHKTNSQHNSPIKHKRERLLHAATPPLTKPKTLGQHLTVKAKDAQNTAPILRATYELKSSRAVEDLLRKREEDLRTRRQHVERLMQWHQRLDEEEAEVLNLERQLLSYNNAPYLLEQRQQETKLSTATKTATKEKLTPTGKASSANLCEQANYVSPTKKKCASRAHKMEKRLKEIDKSLKELSHISASSTTSGVMGPTNNEKEDSFSSATNQEIDFVRTTGLKLNKLWKRLTSQQIEKFEPTSRYKLCKSDLERLYEEAKMAVLRDFAEDEERIAKELLEKTASNLSSTASPVGNLAVPATTCDPKILDVPMLNLNFSSGHSEVEEESANNSQHNATQQGNYSPSVAEENFRAQVLLNSSASSETTSEQQIPVEDKQTKRLENNVQMFLALSQRIQASSTSGRHPATSTIGKLNQAPIIDRKLQRSLSDTEISDVPTRYKAEKTTTSQKTLETIASHTNSSIAIGYFNASAQHQRSQSSIVEMTYIPSTQTVTPPSNNTDYKQTPPIHTTDKQNETQKDLDKVNHVSPYQTNSSRYSVICSVGSVEPLKTSPETSADIATITEDAKTSKSLKSSSDKQKSSFSGQVGTNSETTAKEISSKLDEISAAVAKLSQMNALPSYESVAHTHLRNKSIEESNDETNLSGDASSSYSFHFENITTDKHSSPGSSTSLNTNSLVSKTYTKEVDIESASTTARTLQTHADTSTSPNSTKSKTFINDDAKASTQTFTQSMLENRILDTYEDDFEFDLSNVTHIEDITIPAFETTAETTQNDDDDDKDSSTSSSKSKENNMEEEHLENVSAKLCDKTYNVDELKNPLSVSNSGTAKMDLKSPTQSPDRQLLPPPSPLPPPPPQPSLSSSASAGSSPITSPNGSNHLMPDIINELELRRHQLILDNEHLKQYEHVTAVPYMYVREIPNKPPPPYVPPAHGSPMTTIFPSEDRIKDITFRRTHELYCQLLKTEYCNEKGEKLPSVMEEQITNIYERIILDICREYLEDHGEILQDGDPINFHSQLAFFNPPNRLRCIQDAIYKEVRTCLAMDKIQPKRTQIYSVYGQRAKQDHIGKIIIQEMYDEDDRWCNFHREESEVLHLMVEEMINKNIALIAKEILLEEGGTIDEESSQVLELEEDTILEENVANHQAEDKSQFEESIEATERKRQQHSQLETSSILAESVDEVESTTQYTILDETTANETKLQENLTNLAITPNVLPTCT